MNKKKNDLGIVFDFNIISKLTHLFYINDIQDQGLVSSLLNL